MIPISVQHILNCYSTLLALSSEECEQVGRTYPIPKFEEAVLTDLCHTSIEVLKLQKPLLELNSPIYVIGDIHGNIFDLIRIFIHSNPPPTSRFLFLGDYVDRGQFSIEVVTLLLSLQVAYPEHIYLIRGNHEFECVNSFYGFKDECSKHYSSKGLYEEFNIVFSYLPLAAIVNKSVFCVHGGLSPQLLSLEQFDSLKRPMKLYDPEFVADLVWSDPSAENDSYVRSNRGTGVTFGTTAIHDFMTNFSMTTIIRAHQCVQPGISRFDGHFVYTVFSCSNYAEACQNRCGIIFINSSGQIQAFSLPPLEQIERKKTKMEVKLAPSNIPKTKCATKTLSLKVTEINNHFKGIKNSIPRKLTDSFIQVHVGPHKPLLPKLT